MDDKTTLSDTALKECLKVKANIYYKMALEHYTILEEVKPLNFTFDLKGRTAGRAWYATNTIQINLQLARDNFNDFMEQTIPHEVAHIIARKVYGTLIKPHGRQWKSVMLFFGCNPARCHDYDTQAARKTKRYFYNCECGKKLYLKRKTAAYINNGNGNGSGYKCKTCQRFLNHPENVSFEWSK
jgi:SprT protein